ncbi:hypothetical protein, partial [Pseudomonas savastanoi]|uniref:hypothetical protein n=1 Tax=Pseudomonas savastanoi TaxID=29438 RepID=UPI001C7F62A2
GGDFEQNPKSTREAGDGSEKVSYFKNSTLGRSVWEDSYILNRLVSTEPLSPWLLAGQLAL